MLLFSLGLSPEVAVLKDGGGMVASMTASKPQRARFQWLTGELKDQGLEQDYLNTAWPQTRLIAGTLFFITSFIVYGAMFANLAYQNFDPQLLYVLVPLRFLQGTSYAFVFLVCLKSERPAIYNTAVAISQAVTLASELSNNALAVLPYSNAETPPLPFIVVILFSYYTLIPARFAYTIAFGLITSACYCLVSALHFSTLGYLVLMFAFVNFVGIAYGRFVNRLQRSDHISRIELERAESEALEARGMAERASIEKSKFIAVASHDLRQPLHAMGLWIDTLTSQIKAQRDPVVAATVSHLTTAKNSLDGLLDRLLHVSHLDSGTTEVKHATILTPTFLSELQSRFMSTAKQKAIRFDIRGAEVAVRSDPVLLARILDNLTDNALKYAPHGSRVLIAARKSQGSVRFQVWNTGSEIPAEELENIFDEFHQSTPASSQSFRGLGLGLSIVRRLCQLLNHDVRVWSHANLTMFEVLVPISEEPALQPDATNLSRYNLDDEPVLLIDDDKEIRDAMDSLLGRWGMNPNICSGREDAFASIEQQSPALIVVDQHLADGDTGIELANDLLDKLADRPPVLVMSGETSAEAVKTLETSGFRTLTKPVKPAKLRMILSQMLLEAESGTQPAS